MSFSGVKRHLGIDISHGSMKWIEIWEEKTGLLVHGYGIHLLDSGSFKEDAGNVLGNLVRSGQIGCREAHIAVPSVLTLKEKIHFTQPIGEGDLTELLFDDQEEFFPGIEEKLAFDCFVSSEYEMSVVAVRERDINSQISMLQKGGLKTKTIEPDSDAIVRLVFLYDQIEEDNRNFYIVVDEKETGCRAIVFNIEEILFEIDFAQSVDESAIDEEWERMMRQAQSRLVEFKIKKIFFLSRSLYNALSEQIKFPVILMAPYQNIQSSEMNESDQASLTVALGLALRGIDESY